MLLTIVGLIEINSHVTVCFFSFSR
uniref:Uncharacterized protein n=1 Tax=Arundo donax TaxID=35708 RepID=A0A0A9BZN7_ARUDO